jgi:hypothetical protein
VLGEPLNHLLPSWMFRFQRLQRAEWLPNAAWRARPSARHLNKLHAALIFIGAPRWELQRGDVEPEDLSANLIV